MGLEISKSKFQNADFELFRQRLEEETALLESWANDSRFCNSGFSTGLELEGWLVDSNLDPHPVNQWFLKQLNHPLVVPELSRYNIEINGSPQQVSGPYLGAMATELQQIIDQCQAVAQTMGAHLLLIGTPPTLKAQMMSIKAMSPLKRYAALNQQITRNLGGRPIQIQIASDNNQLHMHLDNVLMASAATSLQFQMKVPVHLAKRFFNVAQILSGPMVALAANSPYMLGQNLWQESRVPMFEQAINGSPDAVYSHRPRAHFGHGYIADSFTEDFRHNLDQFSVLLPMTFNDNPEDLSHLNLHNGTVWKWNRFVVGRNSRNGQPHVRIEHRSPSAAPTSLDAIANLAFFLGATHALATGHEILEHQISFDFAKYNFYQAAQKGLDASVFWKNGKTVSVKNLLLESLIPAAKQGLLQLGTPEKDVELYIDNIIAERVKSGQNGAVWQTTFAAQNGNDLRHMTAEYLKRQNSNTPVHEWSL